MKRKYANVGEKVRIIEPLDFIRCGYPLSSGEIDRDPELRKRKYELMNAAAKAMFPNAVLTMVAAGWGLAEVERDDDTLHYDIDNRIASKLAAAATMAILIEKGFGGNERKIFEENSNYLSVGMELEVTNKKFVKTGRRYNGWSGYSYEGEYDYVGPQLADQKTHCVYTLDGWIRILAKNTERI